MDSLNPNGGLSIKHMDVNEQIRTFNEFFEQHYQTELLEQVRKGEQHFAIDFTDLSKFEPALADHLLDEPEEVLKAGELAIQQMSFDKEIKRFSIRVKNLPDSQTTLIRNIRSTHLGKFLTIVGVVRQKSDVRPQVTAARFECPSCGNIINVLQLDNKFKEPTKCGCGRKGKFRILSKDLVDAQGIVLEEAAEDLEGGEQPKRINILLKNDLVSPTSEKKTNPGSKIIIVGQIKEVPIILKSGSQSTRFDLMFEANYVEPVEEDFSDITISSEEEEKILAISRDPKVYEKMIGSIAPTIYGHERIKEALILQLMGGVKKKRDDGSTTRGDMHMLLIGDPGAGKSMMLKRVNIVSPKSRFVSGKGASGAGLTAAVVKDEFLSGWSLEAGALVLANKGMVCIDELDKMSVEDRSAMHEALEGQTITISKANIQATLRCETTVLAAANPKFGRFDPYDLVANQINLPPALINRFDLIFPIKDLPDEAKDEIMAGFVLKLHQDTTVQTAEIDTETIRKYIVYARQRVFPKLSDEAIEELKNYYVKMRNAGNKEGKRKAIPISARQLEGLVRLTEASAKVRLSQVAKREDAQRAISLLDFCLRQIALDEETGEIDIDRIASDVPASQRNKISAIKEIITQLEGKLGKTIPIEDIVRAAGEQGLKESDCDEILQKLKRSGDLFEPRRGFISRV